MNLFRKMNRRNAKDSLETFNEVQILSVLPACAQLGDWYLRKNNIEFVLVIGRTSVRHVLPKKFSLRHLVGIVIYCSQKNNGVTQSSTA